MTQGFDVQLVPLLIAASFVMSAVILSLTRKSRVAQRERARNLALTLGLDYLEGEAALETAYGEGGTMGQKALGQLKKLPPFLYKALLDLGPWRLSGRRDGLTVEIFTETRSSGKSSSTWTVARAWLAQPLEAELRIAYEGMFTKLGKSLFGLSDLELGDPEFDSVVRIKAKDSLAAQLLLNRAGTKAALRALVTSHHSAYLTHRYAQWEGQGTRTDPGELAPLLDLLVAAARSLSP